VLKTGGVSAKAEERAEEYLAFVTGYLYRLLRYEARGAGMRWTALMVLTDLALLGPSTQRTLADIEQVREPTMTVLLQQMQKLRWVTRRLDRKNARVKRVAITARGEKELRAAGQLLRKRLRLELDELSETDLAGIAAGLQPLVELLLRRIGEVRKELGK
jgi:DNA-binding MarR family transcriptional regulator